MVFKRSSRVPSTSGGHGSSSSYSGVSNVVPVSDGAKTSGNIKVVVRVRPENAHEAESNKNTVIRILDEHVLIFDPKEESEPDFYHGKRRVGRDLNKKKNRDVKFAFDRVFNPQSSNKDMHENTTKLILDGLLDGYNCSVFAYGATGAGKTFTMLGNYQNPGVMFLTMMDLYQRIESIKEDKICDVAVSYLEVYNEQIRDLLMPGKFLPIREDPQKGVIITGLSLHKPTNADELLQMLDFGNRNRTQHPTDANAESSRSHAVFQVFVRQRDRTAGMSANVRVAKMSLIDLAGSERATVTTNRGARFREGANINKSLLALGNCINALAEGKSKGYVPYRNSKLTRLLKDSLGGNCRTVMIAAVSPSSLSYEDTYNTLNYANRAKNIKADLKRNVVSVDYHISKYAKIVDELRLEVSELRAKLKLYEDGTISATKAEEKSTTDVNKAEIDRLKADLVVVFEDRRSIRKDVLELESSERDLEMKIHSKARSLNRVNALSSATVGNKMSDRISHAIESSQRRMNKIVQRKTKFVSRMAENESRLQRVQNDIGQLEEDSLSSQLLESQLRNHHLEIELIDTKRHVKCLKKLCRFEEMQAKNTDKIVTSLIKAYRKVYYILKGHGFATADVVSEFESIQHLIEGERDVAWADQSMCRDSIGSTSSSQVNETMDVESLGRRTGEDTLQKEENSDSFDINKILSFPMLSSVSLLTLTPKRNGTPKHMTPISCMKNSKVSSLKPFNMKKELACDVLMEEATTKVSPVTPVREPSEPACGILSPAPPGIPVCGPPSSNTPRKISDKQLSNGVLESPVPNSTRNAVDGIQMLHNSPVANTTVDLEAPCLPDPHTPVVKPMDNTFTLTPPLPPRVPFPKESCAQTPHMPIPIVSNATVTKSVHIGTPCCPGERQILHSGTVTKSGPLSGVIETQANPPIQSGTVTKQRSASLEDKASIHDIENRPSVVRSMDFTNERSPLGKMSFADALKSPGRALAQPLSCNDCSISPVVRSPLASRENLPNVKHGRNNHNLESNIPNKQRKVMIAGDLPKYSTTGHQSRLRQPTSGVNSNNKRLTASTSSIRSRSALTKTQESLYRMGLPSASDTRAFGKNNHVQLTRSSSLKRNSHRRSLSADGQKFSAVPKRVPTSNNSQSSSRSLFKTRSKSTTQLPRRPPFI